MYYNALLPDLLLSPLQSATPADQKLDGDYAKLQRAGTCYAKCVAAGMDYLLKRLGMPKRKTKHMTFALRREYMLRCDSELGWRSSTFDSGDKTVLTVGAHQTAAAALKERRRPWPGGAEGLSTQDMGHLNHVLGSIASKVNSIISHQNRANILRLEMKTPAVTYTRFQGFEMFKAQLDTSAINRTTHHGDVSDEALALGGDTIELQPPPSIDFRILSKPRSSFSRKNLSAAVEYLDQVLSLCDALEKREGMPERSKKLHIESALAACFLDALPLPGDRFWTGTTDARIQRDALRRIHRCMCIYTAACLSLPADLDAVSARCVTTVTMFAVFECVLRTNSRNPLPLSAQLKKDKRCIPIVSLAGGSKSFMHASAAMQTKHPKVLLARNAACAQLEAVATECAGNEPLLQHPSGYKVTAGDSTQEFVKDMCERSDPASTGGIMGRGSVFAQIKEDAPALKGVDIPREGQSPPKGKIGPMENLVGWMMDDGGALKEWAWYRNASLLARLMLASAPGVDRTKVHSEYEAELKFSIKKSKWPASVNKEIILEVNGFTSRSGLRVSAPVSPGSADPAQYGIKSTTPRGASEDDVLHAERLDNFNNALNEKEAETLFGSLVCPYNRVPMLINFFDRDRLTCLCASKIRKLLDAGIFEPSTWAKRDDRASFEFAPVKEEKLLATQHGILFNELFHSPSTTIAPLFELLKLAYTLASEQQFDGPYVQIILFVFRLHVYIEGVYRQVLCARRPTDTDEGLLQQLATYREVDGRTAIKPWMVQARAQHDTFGVSQMMVHLMLTVPPLPKEQPSGGDTRLERQDIHILYSAMAYLNCWFPWGVQAGSDTSEAQSGILGTSESHLFALWDQLRCRALEAVSATSASEKDDLMNMVLKTVTEGSQVAAPGWKESDAGRFEHPSGDITIDLQTGEVFFKAGAGMKMPAEIAQHGTFKEIFGNVVPNCTPIVNKHCVNCFTASHDNVRYTFEDWDNEKRGAATSPGGLGAASAIWTTDGQLASMSAPRAFCLLGVEFTTAPEQGGFTGKFTSADQGRTLRWQDDAGNNWSGKSLDGNAISGGDGDPFEIVPPEGPEVEAVQCGSYIWYNRSDQTIPWPPPLSAPGGGSAAFVSEPCFNDAGVQFVGKSFSSTSVAQLSAQAEREGGPADDNAAVVARWCAVLTATFKEFAKILKTDEVFASSDLVTGSSDGVLLKHMRDEHDDSKSYWIEFRCSRTEGTVLGYELTRVGRRLYRSHFFSSAHAGALTSMVPSTQDRDGPPLPKDIATCAGASFMRLSNLRSVIYHRNRGGRGNPKETFIQSAQLRGLVPGVLLSNFQFWAPHGTNTLNGEPRRGTSSWFDYSLTVTLHSSPDGSVEADVCRTNNADGQTFFLLDLSRAQPGTFLHRVARKCEAFEPLSHLLAWSPGRPRPGESTELATLEFPRLQLRFAPQFDSIDTTWRLYSVDYSTFYISDVCIGDRDSLATQLVGMPQALILQNLNDEIRFVVPTPPPVRPKIKTTPFHTNCVLDRHSIDWLILKRRYFMYDLHLSESFVACETVAQTLYLCLCRILAREYEQTVPLLRSLRTDVPFTSAETRLLDLIMGIEDTHPNAISVIYSICQVAKANGYKPTDEQNKQPPGEEQHVAAVCRHVQDASLDLVSVDTRDQRIETDVPRSNLQGGQYANDGMGLYGFLAASKGFIEGVDAASPPTFGNIAGPAHCEFGWEKVRTASAQGKMEVIGKLLDMDTVENAVICGYWMLISGLKSSSGAERELLLRTTRLFIIQCLNRHGTNRSARVMLHLLAVVWKIAESGQSSPQWPMYPEKVRGHWVYLWNLQDDDNQWNTKGYEWLQAAFGMAQQAVQKAGVDWGPDADSFPSHQAPHRHEAFATPDYQMQPRGVPTADSIDQPEIEIAPLHMCSEGAALELDPDTLQCLASPDHGVFGGLPVKALTEKNSTLDASSPDDGSKLHEAQTLLYDAMGQDSVGKDEWQRIKSSFEEALDDLQATMPVSAPTAHQTQIEEAHGGMGYACTQLGELELAEQHLNKALPFDLSHHASTKSRIAREMMTRVALDYQQYCKNQRTASDRTLACLPPEMIELQMARADGRSEVSPCFAETIRGLREIQKYLETVKAADLAFVLAATQSLTDQCNSVLADSADRRDERCVFALQRFAWYRPEISFSFLTGSILSKRMAEDLQKLNPFLSRDAIDSIRTMAVGALLRSNRANWVNLTLTQLKKSISLVNSNLENSCISAGYDLADARVAAVACKYDWKGDGTGDGTNGEALPLAWLAKREREFEELCAERGSGVDDPSLFLRYAAFDPQRAMELASDPDAAARIKGLCTRGCCDDRGARVRDRTMVPSGEMKMRAAQQMKNNVLMLTDSTKSVAGLLAGKRCHARDAGSFRYRAPSGKVVRTNTWALDPRIIVFEYRFGYMLRKRQYELTRELEGAALQGGSRCNQMIMGAGKTTVIGPLLAMMLSGASPVSETPKQKGSAGLLVMQCVPGALLAMSIDVMRTTFSTVVSKDVLTLKFKRGDSDSKATMKLQSKVEGAQENRSIICTTPDVIKSIFLKFVELTVMLSDESAPFDGGGDRDESDEEWEEDDLAPQAGLAVSAETGRMDKFRQAMNTGALTSEPQWKIGQKVQSRDQDADSESGWGRWCNGFICSVDPPKASQGNEWDPDASSWTWDEMRPHPDGDGKKMPKKRRKKKGKQLMNSREASEAALNLSKIIKLWRTDALLMMDEVDLLLHPLKSELNFPIGEKNPYDLSDPDGERWTLPIFVLDFCLITRTECSSSDYPLVFELFEAEVEECEAALKKAINAGYACLALQRNPHLILLSQRYYTKTIRPILCRWLGLWLEMKSRRHAESPHAEADPTAIVNHAMAAAYVGETEIEVVQRTAQEQKAAGVSDLFLKLMNLGRQWMLTFIPHVLSKVNRVGYGLLREEDMASMPPNMSAARKMVAVPFVGKDVPSQAAEFAHPEVLIGLTIVAYRYEGLRSFDVREIVSMLKQSAVREVGSYQHRKSNKQFKKWVDRAKQRLTDDQKSEGADLELRTIQVEEPKQLTQAHDLLRYLPDLVYYHLTTLIFPRTMHSQVNKISASGQALGSGMIFKQRIGFSGTPSSLLPTELSPCHFEAASEGKIIATLCDPKLCAHTVYPKVGKAWTVEGLLKHIAAGPFHALIDTGALITGYTNFEVAEYLLKVGLRGKLGCVYLDDHGDKRILLRGSRTPQLLSQCGVAMDARFTFCE